MNIFVFHPSPWKSALWLDDKRKNKMILETAQILSTVIYQNSPDSQLSKLVYKSTHKNHPCTVWASKSKGNFEWLLSYLESLGVQRGKPHKTLGLIPYFYKYLDIWDCNNAPTEFVNCAKNSSQGVDYSTEKDVYLAYRKYISDRWKNDKREPTWSQGVEPEWRVL